MLETTTILHAEVAFQERPLVAPLILSTGAIHTITEATATVTVDVAGRRANAAWLDRLPGLFDPRHGMHELPAEVPMGLGTS